MTQLSWFWNDGGGGHASASPYSDTEYADFFGILLASDAAKGFVLPDYLNDLEVTEKTVPDMSVDVASGGALMRGRGYYNDATVNLAISAADGSNPRLDIVVLRTTFAANTVTVVILEGTPAATPSLPALTQNTTTYEIPLAYVWVGTGVSSITDEDIEDQRLFAPNFDQASNALNENLIFNSEWFMTAASAYPEGWDRYGTPSTWSRQTKPSQQSRFNAISTTADAADEGWFQKVPVKASTVYAIKGLINVTAGDQGKVVVTDDGTGPPTITREINRTGSWVEVLIYYTTTADATQLELRLLCAANTDVVQFGQFMVVQGYLPGEFRTKSEVIMFNNDILDANWNAKAVTAGMTYTIDWTTEFDVVDATIHAVYVGITAAGTLANGEAVYARVQSRSSSSELQMMGFQAEDSGGNNFTVYGSGWVGVFERTSTVWVTDEGAPTGLTVTVELLGVQT